MAGSRKPPAANQYGLDFESAYAERHAQLISALEVTGLTKYAPLARLIFNLQERAGGDPVGLKLEELGRLIGWHESTIRRWQSRLAAIGLLEIEYRTAARGGTKTNLISVNWMTVRLFALDRAQNNRPSTDRLGNGGNLDRPTNLQGRPTNLEPRPTKLVGPYKELSSCLSSLELNTTTTTALPHALPVLSEEEEVNLGKIVKLCYEKIPSSPRYLERAMRTALGRGFTIEQLRTRCSWFSKHWTDWDKAHRAGVFHDGLAEATPDMQPHQGWPYQR